MSQNKIVERKLLCFKSCGINRRILFIRKRGIMNMNFIKDEFYPTPKELLEKIFEGFDWKSIKTILEPSAGKGDIVNFITDNKYNKYYKYDIDCIEKDADLQNTLAGSGKRVVFDDFLKFDTFKHYDLIVMNPPFSGGAKHLLKAIHMQESSCGGAIICILNAETLKNPYSCERKDLLQCLDKYQAQVEYMQHEFSCAERKTEVEIAVVKMQIPEKQIDSSIMEKLRRKHYSDFDEAELTDIAVNDFVKAIVMQYNIEVEAGINLIKEYKALVPYMLNTLSKKESPLNAPILSLKLDDEELSSNNYVKAVRHKYWTALFTNPKFTGNMTSNQREEYLKMVNTLCDYDFSEYNINKLQIEMSQKLVKGIEDCIIELFDKLSQQYAYYKESSNVHYYNGWCSNKAWIINKKVVLPNMQAFGYYYGSDFDPCRYDLFESLKDIEKALNYLDGGITDGMDIENTLRKAKEDKQSSKIRCKYFDITFYKKGTCHITFTNEELLKKLNIFGSQQKGWLPYDYGNKAYSDMTKEEQEVIDAFEGVESYNKTLINASYFIYNPSRMLSIGQASE